MSQVLLFLDLLFCVAGACLLTSVYELCFPAHCHLQGWLCLPRHYSPRHSPCQVRASIAVLPDDKALWLASNTAVAAQPAIGAPPRVLDDSPPKDPKDKGKGKSKTQVPAGPVAASVPAAALAPALALAPAPQPPPRCGSLTDKATSCGGASTRASTRPRPAKGSANKTQIRADSPSAATAPRTSSTASTGCERKRPRIPPQSDEEDTTAGPPRPTLPGHRSHR